MDDCSLVEKIKIRTCNKKQDRHTKTAALIAVSFLIEVTLLSKPLFYDHDITGMWKDPARLCLS